MPGFDATIELNAFPPHFTLLIIHKSEYIKRQDNALMQSSPQLIHVCVQNIHSSPLHSTVPHLSTRHSSCTNSNWCPVTEKSHTVYRHTPIPSHPVYY